MPEFNGPPIRGAPSTVLFLFFLVGKLLLSSPPTKITSNNKPLALHTLFSSNPERLIWLIFFVHGLGILLISLSIDEWVLESGHLDLVKAFYYRKAVNPPLWYTGILSTLFLAGVVSHSMLFIRLFTFTSSLGRKVVDLLAISEYPLSLHNSLCGEGK